MTLALAVSPVWVHGLISEDGTARPPSIGFDSGRSRMERVDVATTGAGGSPAPPSSHLIGSLAVDGQVESHLFDFGLHPDAEQQIDDLDDDERADDRVARSVAPTAIAWVTTCWGLPSSSPE